MLTDYHNEALRAEIQLMRQLYNIHNKWERWQILQQYETQMLQLMERKYEEYKRQSSTIRINATPWTSQRYEPEINPDRKSDSRSSLEMTSPSLISAQTYTDFIIPDDVVDRMPTKPKLERSGLYSDSSSRAVIPRPAGSPMNMHTSDNDRGARGVGNQSGRRQIDPQQEQHERPVSSPSTLGDDEARIVADLKSQLHWILGIEARASVASSILQEEFESLIQSPMTIGSDDVRRLADYKLQVDKVLGIDSRASVASSSDDLDNSEAGDSIQQEWSDDDEDSGTTKIDLFPAKRNDGDGGIRSTRPNGKSAFGGMKSDQTRSATAPSQTVAPPPPTNGEPRGYAMNHRHAAEESFLEISTPPPTNGKPRGYATNHRRAAEESFLEIFTPPESAKTRSSPASSQTMYLTPPRVSGSAWRETSGVRQAKTTQSDDSILPYPSPRMWKLGQGRG